MVCCGTVLRTDSVKALVDKPFIRWTEEWPYVTRSATNTACYVNLRYGELTTHSFDYAALLRPFDWHDLLANLQYWLKETVFDPRSKLKSTDLFFLNCHSVDVLDISPVSTRALFVKSPESWESYECCSLVHAPTPVVFAYHTKLVLSESHRNFCYRVGVAEHFIFFSILFVASALYGMSCTASGDFHCVEHLRRCRLFFLCLRLFWTSCKMLVFWSCPWLYFSYSSGLPGSHRSIEVDWNSGDKVDQFSCNAGYGIF